MSACKIGPSGPAARSRPRAEGCSLWSQARPLGCGTAFQRCRRHRRDAASRRRRPAVRCRTCVRSAGCVPNRIASVPGILNIEFELAPAVPPCCWCSFAGCTPNAQFGILNVEFAASIRSRSRPQLRPAKARSSHLLLRPLVCGSSQAAARARTAACSAGASAAREGCPKSPPGPEPPPRPPAPRSEAENETNLKLHAWK